MRINDEEDLLRSLQAFVKANLNTQIAAINAEKADKFKIDEIPADDDHYVFAGELLDLPNHIFVNFAIDREIETEIDMQNRISMPVIFVEVAFDNPKKAGTYFKSMRYMRAIFETILQYQESTIEVDGLKVIKAIPMVVTTQSTSLVVSGVQISAAIG